MNGPFANIPESEPPLAGKTLARSRFRLGEWTVDPAANEVGLSGESTKLEPKVMAVLVYLADRRGQVVTRIELESAVWAGTVVSYDALSAAIQKLRKVFGDDPRRPRLIETVSKKGYRLIAPVERVDASATLEHPSTGEAPATSGPAKLPVPVWVTLAVLLLALLGALLWVSSSDSPEDKAGEAAEPKTVAVLPFDNLSGDIRQDYFADGMTDDLITSLAQLSDLLVIARDSTFVYKGQTLEPRDVAARLNARYLVYGSVRRTGERLRINAQLVDAATGKNLWAERYKGDTTRLFELQDKITQKIVTALAARMNVPDRGELARPRTENTKAYDAFLLGRQLFFQFKTKEQNRTARELFAKAIALDPGFAMAYAMLAWTHAFDATNGWSDARETSLRRALELATRAIELDEAMPVAYFVRGICYWELGEPGKALVESDRAIAYDPNYAGAHVLDAMLLYYNGRPEEGLQRIEKAIRLNPHHPYNYRFHLGQAYYILGRYSEAIKTFRAAMESNPTAERCHIWLAAALGQSGDTDEAAAEIDQLLGSNRELTLARIKEAFPFKDPADLEHFLDGLRKAGLSESEPDVASSQAE